MRLLALSLAALCLNAWAQPEPAPLDRPHSLRVVSHVEPQPILPIAFYSFEGSGTTVADDSGNGNTGTIGAGVSRNVNGKYGACLDFAGGQMTIPSLIGAGPFTISTWIRLDSYGTGAGRIADNGVFYFNPNSFESKLYASSGGGINATSAPGSMPLNIWTHVAVTRDAAGRFNFYVNGVRSDIADQQGGVPAVGGALIIGNRASGDRALDGCLDDLRIYDRALSASELNLQ